MLINDGPTNMQNQEEQAIVTTENEESKQSQIEDQKTQDETQASNIDSTNQATDPEIDELKTQQTSISTTLPLPEDTT